MARARASGVGFIAGFSPWRSMDEVGSHRARDEVFIDLGGAGFAGVPVWNSGKGTVEWGAGSWFWRGGFPICGVVG
jgi:hypothetical protein